MAVADREIARFTEQCKWSRFKSVKATCMRTNKADFYGGPKVHNTTTNRNSQCVVVTSGPPYIPVWYVCQQVMLTLSTHTFPQVHFLWDTLICYCQQYHALTSTQSMAKEKNLKKRKRLKEKEKKSLLTWIFIELFNTILVFKA